MKRTKKWHQRYREQLALAKLSKPSISLGPDPYENNSEYARTNEWTPKQLAKLSRLQHATHHNENSAHHNVWHHVKQPHEGNEYSFHGTNEPITPANAANLLSLGLLGENSRNNSRNNAGRSHSRSNAGRNNSGTQKKRSKKQH
jgi:hypothetical protein